MQNFEFQLSKRNQVLYKPVALIIVAFICYLSFGSQMPEGLFFPSFSTGLYQVFLSLLFGNFLLHFASKHFLLKWFGILFAPKPNKSLGLLLSTLMAFAWLLANLQMDKWTSASLAYTAIAFTAGSAISAFVYELVGFKAKDLGITYQIENDRQEAFIAVIASAVFLGTNFAFLPSDFIPMAGNGGIVFPIYLAIIGLVVTFVAAVIVGEKPKNEKTWLTISITSMVIMMIASVELVTIYLPNHWSINGVEYQPSDILLAVQLGLLAGLLAGISVKFYTLISETYIQFVIKNQQKRVWLNVALRVFINVVFPFLPIILISAALLISFFVGGIYATSISFLGMLSNVGLSLVIDGNKLNAEKMQTISFWERQKLALSSPQLPSIWKIITIVLKRGKTV